MLSNSPKANFWHWNNKAKARGPILGNGRPCTEGSIHWLPHNCEPRLTLDSALAVVCMEIGSSVWVLFLHHTAWIHQI